MTTDLSRKDHPLHPEAEVKEDNDETVMRFSGDHHGGPLDPGRLE